MNSFDEKSLEDLMNDVNFPLPDTLDLDFDYDCEGQGFVGDGRGPMPAVGTDYMLDQQYGAVAALATQVIQSAKPSYLNLAMYLAWTYRKHAWQES